MYIVIPSFEGIELMSSFQAAHTHVYILKSICKSCSCPSCGMISSRVHSRYTRFVQDLAIQQISIHLQLQVKKFFCDSPTDICRAIRVASIISTKNESFARNFTENCSIHKLYNCI